MSDIRPYDERILEVGDGDDADLRRGGAAVGDGVALGGLSVQV